MSRKKLIKPKKAAPISLAWLRQVIDREWPDDAPAKGSIVAVAAYFVKTGNPDGRNVFPAIDTMARDLRLGRHTVLDVTKTMQAEGMLERVGKIRSGTINYRLRLEAVDVEDVSDSASNSASVSVPSSAQRGTLPITYDHKGVGGGGESSPDCNTPTAVATGSNIQETTTPRVAVVIHGEHADLIVSEFVAAFDAKFAQRARRSTVAAQRLEPHQDKLRTAIITKIDAGWPQDHLIDRITGDLPNVINTITGLVTNKLSQLPDQPDSDARRFIPAQNVKATAERSLQEAELKLQEQTQADQLKRDHGTALRHRNKAIKRLRAAVAKYSIATDHDAETLRLVALLDGDCEDDDDPAIWPLSAGWVEMTDAEIEELRDESNRRVRVTDAINQSRWMLGCSGIAHDKQDQHIDERLAAHNLDRDTIKHQQHHESGIAILTAYITEIEHTIPSGQQQW